jgi:hypothetical protein
MLRPTLACEIESIVLAGFAVEALKAHRVRQEEMRQAAGDS